LPPFGEEPAFAVLTRQALLDALGLRDCPDARPPRFGVRLATQPFADLAPSRLAAHRASAFRLTAAKRLLRWAFNSSSQSGSLAATVRPRLCRACGPMPSVEHSSPASAPRRRRASIAGCTTGAVPTTLPPAAWIGRCITRPS